MFETVIPSASVFDLVGIAGFSVYVCNYTLLTVHKLHSHDTAYFVLNLVAASLVLIGLTASFNLASALIQMFWVLISLTAICLRLRRGRSAPAGSARKTLFRSSRAG